MVNGGRRWAAVGLGLVAVATLVTASAGVPAPVTVLVPSVYLAPPPRPAAPPPPPTSITVVATGDVLLHQRGPLVSGARAEGRANGVEFDFRPVFADVAPIITGADLAVCHLETPIGPPQGPFSGYPVFSVQPQIVDALLDAGYDTCSTASNHSWDGGFDGLVRTLDVMDSRGLRHTGTFRTEAESRVPLILDVDGVRIAQISWTFGLNGFRESPQRPWAVNDFRAGPHPDLAGALAEAAAARRAGADVVIASVHCCVEYTHEPTPAQDAIAAALLASPDIDLVLGHHAHVVQPVESINGKWVAHGLGNHVAQRTGRPATSDSVIVRFTLTRGPDGRFTTTAAEAIPTRIRTDPTGLAVVRTGPGDPAYDRVVDVLGRRGGVEAGLVITPG